MKIQVIAPQELTPDQIQTWIGMMNSADGTDSPFFHPEYVRTLSLYRDSVRVAIITKNDQTIAFFPFEKHERTGRPLGVKLCDFQGLISSPNLPLTARTLLAGCELSTWHYDHVVATQPAFKEWHLRHEESPYIDLSNGFDAYVSERKKAGIGAISETRRKHRKLEREIGPLHFAWGASDQEAFDTLIQWKSAQRKRTNTFDVLKFPWVVQTLNALCHLPSDNFKGTLFTLRVNDTLVAASLCIQTKTVLHKWFSAYNVDFRKYSPGHLLTLAITEAAAQRGIQRIDLGRGKDEYKNSLRSGAILVGEGTVDSNPMRQLTRRVSYWLLHQMRNSPFCETLQSTKRRIKKTRQAREMSPSESLPPRRLCDKNFQ